MPMIVPCGGGQPLLRVHRPPAMSSSVTSSVRLLPPKVLLLNHNNPKKSFLPLHQSLFFFHRHPISFQRVAGPPSSKSLRSHPEQQQQQSDSSSQEDRLTKLLPPALRKIVSLFQSVGDSPSAKYQQLIHYASLPPLLDPRFKDDDHRVRGCVSQVWVRAFPDPANPAAVQFEADSDSVLTKGLCALLVIGLSGSPASVIASVPPDFVLLLGLRQTLTPSRNNGFLNMLLLMQKKAKELQCSQGEFDLDGEEKNLTTNVNGWRPLDYTADTNGAGETSAFKDNGVVKLEVGSPDGRIADGLEEEVDSGGHGIMDGDPHSRSPDMGSGGGRKERIEMALEKGLSPVELDVEDVSHLHAGHAGVAGSASGETHFEVRVVSEEFQGKSSLKRHRLIYRLLQDELQSGLHSLSIVAMTPSEATSST